MWQHDIGLVQMNHCPLSNHTWPNWKTHWTAAFAKMRNINGMTAWETSFGANQAAELKQVQQMASSLDNLAKKHQFRRMPPLTPWWPPMQRSPRPLLTIA
jgi:hypothetical protein